MDPTKLSVLSVLRTAMPTATGTDIVLPTGSATPQWYKDLPADVMVLLAQMYPATPTATDVVSQTSSVTVNKVDGTETAVEETASSVTSQTTLTRTLELVPMATVSATSLSTAEPNESSANGTFSTGKSSPTHSAFSTGAKNTVATGKWSVVMGLSVAALFCFFA